MNGFLVVNKPVGITTYDIIRHIKRIIGAHKIGHAGTLDPFASGVVIIAIGRAYTKQLSTILTHSKQYVADIVLGKTTDTYDIDGQTTHIHTSPIQFTQTDIHQAIQPFIGDIDQRPPAFSAKKINGVPAYTLARNGTAVQLKPSRITIHSIDIITYVSYPAPTIQLQIHCSSGTYIRSLAYDIGQLLGVGGYLSQLTRTAVGDILLAQATDLSDLTEATLPQVCLPALPI